MLVKLQIAPASPTKVWCQNLSTIFLVTNPILYARNKHVELDHHLVRENVVCQQLLVSIFHLFNNQQCHLHTIEFKGVLEVSQVMRL